MRPAGHHESPRGEAVTRASHIVPCKPTGGGPASGRVAVLIPVYNDDGRLAETLHSLRGQGVALTAVIVDDGSSPPLAVDTAEWEFPVVLLRQDRNGGIERALNAGLEYILAAGFEYVARLDNGDRCMPGRIARQMAFLDGHPETALVGSDVEWRRADGSLAFAMRLPSRHEEITRALHHTVCLIHPTVMFRTAIVPVIGGYSYDYPAAEDYEYFRRIADRFRVANVPEVLLATRFDPDGISMRRRRKQLRSKLRIQLAYFRASEPYSHWGILKTLMLMCLPYQLVVQIKRRIPRRAGA